MPQPKILRPAIFQTSTAVIAGFSTRVGGDSPEPFGMNLSFNTGDDRANVIKNRELFFGKLHIGLDELAIPVQRHTTNVVQAKVPGGYEGTDGLTTSEYGLFLTVTVADCVPILLYDPVAKAVAILHAGWRGTAAGIVGKGLEAMNAAFKTHPDDLIACIGPAAGGCCYEVDNDVAAQFPDEIVDRSGRKPRIDLKKANKDQLVTRGVRKESIEISAHCTIHEKDLFHSYRRDGTMAGRMMGVIGIVR